MDFFFYQILLHIIAFDEVEDEPTFSSVDPSYKNLMRPPLSLELANQSRSSAESVLMQEAVLLTVAYTGSWTMSGNSRSSSSMITRSTIDREG